MRESPKVNVFWTISKKRVYGPFLKKERSTVKHTLLCCKIGWWNFLSKESEQTFQEDEAPPHRSLAVGQYLNANVHDRRIGCAGNDDYVLLHWPPRSPDLTPCNFFLWCWFKDLVYVPSLPKSVDDLKTRITEEVLTTIDCNMLGKIWNTVLMCAEQPRARILNICEKLNKSFISCCDQIFAALT